MFQATASRVGQIALNGTQICNVAWKVFVGAAVTGSPIIGPHGHIYVGTLGHNLFRLNANNGTVAWRKVMDGQVNTITIATASPFVKTNRTLYVPTLNKMIALDALTQQEIWRFEHPNINDRCEPAVFSDSNYFFTGLYFVCGSSLYFVDTLDHRVAWNYSVPASDGALSGLAVGPVDGRIFIGSQTSLYVVDGSSGSPSATLIYKMGVVGIPTISNHGRTVYFQGTDNMTYAINTSSGRKEWSTSYGGGLSSSGGAFMDVIVCMLYV